MSDKIKVIRILISSAGKPGIIMLLFSIMRYIVGQLNECSINILIPALILENFAEGYYVKLIIEVICVLVIFLLLTVLLDRIDTIYIRKMYTEISKNILYKVYYKISESDISRFDDSTFYEKNILNMNNIETKTFAAIENMSKLLGCIVAFYINFSLITMVSDDAWVFISVALVMMFLLQFFQTRFNLVSAD